MPFKRKFKRRTYSKKRRYVRKGGYRRRYKKKRFSKPTSMLLRSPTVVSDRVRLKLKYNSYYTLSGGAGTPFLQVFQNSLFDPDLTGSGNQPMGFDQWKNFYNRYRVNAISIKVQGANTNSTNPILFSVFPSLTSTAPGSTSGVFSQPYARTISVPQSSGNSKIYISNYMTTKKMYGYTNIDQEEDFSSVVSASPANLWYFLVYGYSGTTATPTFQGIIKVTYYCEMFERIQLDIS